MVPTFGRRSRASGLLVSALLGTACSNAPSTPAPTPPNVVLLVLDTVRADHLGCYGYRRTTSPRIDEFARTATSFTRAISSAPWTVPSHASMFTGKPPMAHGAHTFPTKRRLNNVNPLHQDHLTLAELLSAEGYETAGFVANTGYLTRHWQLDQGFQTYHVERLYASRLNERVFPWLDRAEPPFFLFVNYIDAHRPYNTEPRPGLLDSPASRDPRLLDRLIGRVMPGTGPVPEELTQQVIDQYDTAIANLDEQVGILLDRLEQLGVGDDTVVVITSDHGEYFGEHRLVEHSKDVYQEAIRVPLLVRGPETSSGGEVDTLVVSNDLPRLILAHFPAEVASRLAQPFPDVPGEHTVVSENYYTRTKDLFHDVWGWRFKRVRQAVFDGSFKLIRSSDGQHELYDLNRDPREQDNLFARRPDVADPMAAALNELERTRPGSTREPDITPLDEELRERLEALGYVGD